MRLAYIRQLPVIREKRSSSMSAADFHVSVIGPSAMSVRSHVTAISALRRRP